MTTYEIYSLLIQSLTALTASLFALWQIFINLRLKRLNDFVSVVLVPDGKNGVIKLLNTGKINLYIHGFEINGKKDYFKKGRIIAAGPLDSAFYWLPLKNIPHSGIFDIKIYLTDEYGKKYVVLGQGESINHDHHIEVRVWNFKTQKKKWKLQNLNSLAS